MAEPDQRRDLRDRFLSVAYDLTVNRSMPFVEIKEVGRALGVDASYAALLNPSSEINGLASYWATKGCIKSQEYMYEKFSLTREGMNEAEGRNRPPEPGVYQAVYVYGDLYNPVIGAHNTNFGGDLNFSAVERRIQEEGGPDEAELRELVREMWELLESGQTLDKGLLTRFNDKLKEHGWLSGAVAGWLLNFATQ